MQSILKRLVSKHLATTQNTLETALQYSDKHPEHLNIVATWRKQKKFSSENVNIYFANKIQLMKGIALVPNAAVRIIDSKDHNSKPWVEENMTHMNQTYGWRHWNAHSIDNNVNNITCVALQLYFRTRKKGLSWKMLTMQLLQAKSSCMYRNSERKKKGVFP